MGKKLKKLISMLLILTMVSIILAGCGKSEKVEKDTDGKNKEEAEAEDEEMKDISAVFMSLSPMDENKTKDVVAAVNKITEEKINVHVDIKWYDPNTYATQIPMTIQANEKLDLIHYTPVPGAGFSAFQGQHQFAEIGALLTEYAPETVELLGELLDATSNEEGIYGTTCYRSLSSDEYILMRKDILDELGLTKKAENLSSWTEYEEILKVVTESKDMAGISNGDAQGTVLSQQPFFNGSDSFADNSMYNQLGDSYQMIACSEDGKIGCYYFEDEYKQMIDRVADWYSKDYVYKDAATSQDIHSTMLKNNVTFSAIALGELGVKEANEATTGYELVVSKIAEGMIETGAAHKFGFGVPVTSTEPEAAVDFLNLLYTDKDLANILAWGVEGKDWVKNDKGEAAYPEGITAETVQYHTADFLYGNQFNVLPWEGSGSDLRNRQLEIMKNAKVSKYMGFTVDPTPVESEVTACFNVTKEYKAGLASGSVDVEEKYSAFTEKLKASGIETIIAEYQNQLDRWMAEKR